MACKSLIDMEKVGLINQVLKQYFEKNSSVQTIPAKDLMPQFIKAGIFVRDNKNGLPIRNILRKLDEGKELHLIPYVLAERKLKNTNWFFTRTKQSHTTFQPKNVERIIKIKTKVALKNKKDSDENYVLDLCDEILNRKASRQHRFDFLRGDSGVKLPVDAYYADLKLVVEFREYQHTNAVKHFDKPDVMTVSGVHRGEQRKIYDQRRREILPKNGIKLIEISYSDFRFDNRNRILRDRERDLEVVKNKMILK